MARPIQFKPRRTDPMTGTIPGLARFSVAAPTVLNQTRAFALAGVSYFLANGVEVALDAELTQSAYRKAPPESPASATRCAAKLPPRRTFGFQRRVAGGIPDIDSTHRQSCRPPLLDRRQSFQGTFPNMFPRCCGGSKLGLTEFRKHKLASSYTKVNFHLGNDGHDIVGRDTAQRGGPSFLTTSQPY